MDKNEIVTLIQFNFWANERILASYERIPAEQLTQKINPDPGWGDLLGILVHILDTEYGWRALLQSQTADEILEPADFENLASLKIRWEAEKAAWLDYATNLNNEELSRRYGPEPQKGLKVWQAIVHVMCHGIQHRSEAAMLLTGAGRSPGELDFDIFLQENPRHI